MQIPLVTKPLNPFVVKKYSINTDKNENNNNSDTTRQEQSPPTSTETISALESEATTTADAIRNKSVKTLRLSGLKLSKFPVPDFSSPSSYTSGAYCLLHLRVLDISNNPQLGPELSRLPPGFLPPNLEELSLTGCAMTALPVDVATLPRLQKLLAGANCISDPTWAFVSASLLHVGLSYNSISDATLLNDDEVLMGPEKTTTGSRGVAFTSTARSGKSRNEAQNGAHLLSTAADPPPSPPLLPPPAWELLSVDLSHNDITSLDTVARFLFSKTVRTSATAGGGAPPPDSRAFASAYMATLARKTQALTMAPTSPAQRDLTAKAAGARDLGSTTGTHWSTANGAGSRTGGGHVPAQVFRRFPKLAALRLAGNAFCLSPGYAENVKSALAAQPGGPSVSGGVSNAEQGITMLDGKRLDYFRVSTPAAAAGNDVRRPGISAAITPRQAVPRAPEGAEGEAAAADTANGNVDNAAELPLDLAAPPADAQLLINMGPLVLSKNPFQAMELRWQAQIAEAEAKEATVPPELDISAAPLQPFSYYYEFTDVDGFRNRSEPLVVEPPVPPDVASMFDPKLKAATARKPAAPGGSKPGTPADKTHAGKGTGSVPAQGELLSGIPIRSGWVRERDWMRGGFKLSLYKVISTATPRPPTTDPDEEVAAAAAAKAKSGKSKKDEGPPPVEYDISTETVCLGEAQVGVGLRTLLDGQTLFATESVAFHPLPELWDLRGLRMPLKDERHSLQVIASLTMRAAIMPPDPTPGPSSKEPEG